MLAIFFGQRIKRTGPHEKKAAGSSAYLFSFVQSLAKKSDCAAGCVAAFRIRWHKEGMNVALTDHWEDFVEQLIGTGRYSDAGEVVRAALSELSAKEGEIFPPGTLAHLYSEEENRAEAALARELRVPTPDEA